MSKVGLFIGPCHGSVTGPFALQPTLFSGGLQSLGRASNLGITGTKAPDETKSRNMRLSGDTPGGLAGAPAPTHSLTTQPLGRLQVLV